MVDNINSEEHSNADLKNGFDLSRPEEWENFYQIHVFCCINERPKGHRRGSCADKNSKRLTDYMCRLCMSMGALRVRINHSGCLNRCEMGPSMVIYPDGIWYRYNSEADIKEIVDKHVLRGKPVKRLLITPTEGPRH